MDRDKPGLILNLKHIRMNKNLGNSFYRSIVNQLRIFRSLLNYKFRHSQPQD